MTLEIFNKLISLLKDKKSWWLDIIFYFTLAITLALIISYFILILKISFQENRVQQLEEEIVKFGSSRQRDLEKEILGFQKKMNDFEILLGAHKISSNVFDFFEKNIFPNIRFADFQLDTIGSKMELAGESENVLTLARQLAVFKESESVNAITALGLRIGVEGEIIFNVSFSLNPDILTWK